MCGKGEAAGLSAWKSNTACTEKGNGGEKGSPYP